MPDAPARCPCGRRSTTTSSPSTGARTARWCGAGRTGPSGSAAPRPGGRSRTWSSSAPMSHGSLTDAVNASGQVRCTASWIVSTPGARCSIAPRPRGRRVRDDLLAGRAVVPRVVEDAVVAGVRAGEDRRVVRERDGRQAAIAPCRYAVPIVDQPRDVRGLAARRHVVEHVRVRAVEQEADHVLRAAARVEHVGEHLAVLAPRGTCRRRAARTRAARATVGATSTSRPPRDEPVRSARPCRRSRTAPGPGRPRASRARRGGRPGPPSCGRRSGCTQRSGAAGWSNSWAIVLVRVRVGVVGAVGVQAGAARRRGGANLSVDWSASGSAPSTRDLARSRRPRCARKVTEPSWVRAS